MSKASEEFLTEKDDLEKTLQMGARDSKFDNVVRITDAPAKATLLFVCEHAAHQMPEEFANLGLSEKLRTSHIAWDPGAAAVAETLASEFSAPLVAGCVSRLLYDCNRPPTSPSAIPEHSEGNEIPGNIGLSKKQREERVSRFYTPFSEALTNEISKRRAALQLLVTVHSFTPVFHGHQRKVEIGILHGKDARFADAMMCGRPIAAGFDIRLNEPYDAKDGVAHTLDVHGAANGLLNVMIEVRNDLIATEPAQRGMGQILADWLRATMAQLGTGDAA